MIARQIRDSILRNVRWGFSPPQVQSRISLSHFGTDYGGYCLDTSRIFSDSIVYSLGVGEDISFDLELIQKLKVSVQAFDPTPRVRDWLSSQELPPQFHFHPVGIAGFDGEASFYLPPQPEFISHSIIPGRQYSAESIHVPMIRLRTAMQKLGHKKIDVLKVDVEGAEYSILQDISAENIEIGQLLIEFHHRSCPNGISKTRGAIKLLNRMGFKLCYVCCRAEVFTFAK